MIRIPGYRILEKIYTGKKSLVYRGIRESDQLSVMIKTLNHFFPTFEELVLLRNQYYITKNLKIEGIIHAYALENYGQGLAIILEDFGGISLEEYRQNLPLPIRDFFPIALSLIKTLAEIHNAQIIHKDIKPQNILINPITKITKITDFGISSRLPRETQNLVNHQFLQGTLAYISPEQTGRMNREIDYRTDFYSLGVTFYQILTNQLPFYTSDPLEYIHYHIAKAIIPPHEILTDIPPILSDIIVKLMAKIPEERYQNASGLHYDLEGCYQQWQTTGKIVSFPLGRQDQLEHLVIPEKLYGREKEVKILLEAFEHIGNPAKNQNEKTQLQVIFVVGDSGIGKTSVIHEVYQPILQKNGYFIQGKFDQSQQNIPFSAWVQAFQHLVRELLTENPEKLSQWKIKILSVLGENGLIILEVIPELAKIIGSPSSVTFPPENATSNTFNLYLQKFIKIFTTPQHPLVIFLDDLHWTDQSSLELIELLINSHDCENLLLICAYRESEIQETHPLNSLIKVIEKQLEKRPETAINFHKITLNPLDFNSLNQLLAETLNCSLDLALPLTELVAQKTQGNPFFVHQFMKMLSEENLLRFHANNRLTFSPELSIEKGWECDFTKIRSLALTDDLLEFMIFQLKKLPESTQNILKLAACIGHEFALNQLTIITKEPPEKIARDLWPTLEKGLVSPLNDLYTFFPEPQLLKNIENPNLSLSYRFVHHQIKQAAYELIPPHEQLITHLQIGQILLENLPEINPDALFIIVHQLNLARGLIQERKQRHQLAELNRQVGKKAKLTADKIAFNYFKIAVELLDQNSWETDYDLTLSIYISAIESAYLNRELKGAKVWVETVMTHAQTLLDQIKVYEIQLSTYPTQIQPEEAIKLGLNALQLLQIEFPEHPNLSDIHAALATTKHLLNYQNISDLINLPDMKNPEKEATLRILSGLVSPAYQTLPNLLPLIICQMVNLSITYGNTPLSSFAYGLYGLILSREMEDISQGYEWGQLALKILEKFSANYLKTKVFYTVGAYLLHGKCDLQMTINLLKKGYLQGLETRDIELGYSVREISLFSYFKGKELTELQKEIFDYSQALFQMKQEKSWRDNQMIHQVVLNLLGATDNPCQLTGSVYHEEPMLAIYYADNDHHSLHHFYFHKMILSYLFDEGKTAYDCAEKATQYLDAVRGMLTRPLFYFYDSLIRLKMLEQSQLSDPESVLNQVNKNQEKLKKWAESAPMNFLHKYHLVAAVKFSFLQEKLAAIETFELAIRLSKENHYIQEQGLACELAAIFYLKWQKETLANAYLMEAYYSYINWGAKAKIQHLEKKYALFLNYPLTTYPIGLNLTNQISQMARGTLIKKTAETSHILNISSILKASQVISKEIVLDNLITTLMKVIIENIGAEKGILVLKKSGHLVVEARAHIQEVSRLTSIPLEMSQDVPSTVIYYVARTEENFLLENTPNMAPFLKDPYFQTHHPQSILCAPILKQSKLIGILYLENNLTQEAFTLNQIEIVKLLCTQITISLENAIIYDTLDQANQLLECYSRNLQEQVEQRSLALKNAQQQIIAQEKLASLGILIAGVAHELRNPLNFVNNYAESSIELLEEVLPELELISPHLETKSWQNIKSILMDIRENNQAIKDHGNRAERIIFNMIQHGRNERGLCQPTDLNALLEQSVKLAYHSKRVADHTFNLIINRDYDPSIGEIETVSSDLNRAFLNIIDNACYALQLKQKKLSHSSPDFSQDFSPTLWVKTQNKGEMVEISIRDNGIGISPEIESKIFHPFFTTKPPGEGTGLGLSLSHEIIVQQHSGTIKLATELGVYTEFVIVLPKMSATGCNNI